MTTQQSRRTFVKTTAMTGVGYWIAGHSMAAESKSPNEKLNVAIIGVSGRGRANTGGVSSENIVAICDIDDRYLDQAAAKFPKAKRFNDWRNEFFARVNSVRFPLRGWRSR